MANDFQKKEPSKTEKMLYQMAMNMQMMDRSIMSNSAQFLAVGIALDIKPEKMAQILTDDEQLKNYGKLVNEAIDKIEKEKHPEAADAHAGHNHEGHDHAHIEVPEGTEIK